MGLLDDRSWAGKIFTGSWVDGSGGTHTAIEPATGRELATVGVASPGDVAKATELAGEAQRTWARLPYDRRAQVLRRAGQLFVEHADELSDWVVRESGARRAFGESQIVGGAAEECWEAAALAAVPFGEVLRSTQERLSFARQLPVGVVGVISPFNAPVVLAMRAVAPALALGNAVVLKPDLRTAVCGGVALAQVFAEAGLPEGLLHMLPGGADAGQAVVADRHIRVIAFTGSTRAGRAIATEAGRLLKRVHLELGGNSALIVLDDADLDRAAATGAFGSFNHAGQICMASSRHLVASAVAADYTEALAQLAARLPVGDPATGDVAIGPLIDAGQRDAVHGVVTASVDAGARLMTGGEYDGLFYRPTVLADVPLAAPAYQQEIFGPVAPVVTFDSLDEAVRLAAGTEYGLSLGILTRDVGRGLELADRIPSGLVHINDQTINDEAVAPFGGVGDSGTGSRHGGARSNLDAFTETQWLTVRSQQPTYEF